jgi:hypothetical protein
MPEGNTGSITDERKSARADLEDIRNRGATGERIAQSVIADAVRRAAEADLSAQFTKRWSATQ